MGERETDGQTDGKGRWRIDSGQRESCFHSQLMPIERDGRSDGSAFLGKFLISFAVFSQNEAFIHSQDFTRKSGGGVGGWLEYSKCGALLQFSLDIS